MPIIKIQQPIPLFNSNQSTLTPLTHQNSRTIEDLALILIKTFDNFLPGSGPNLSWSHCFVCNSMIKCP